MTDFKRFNLLLFTLTIAGLAIVALLNLRTVSPDNVSVEATGPLHMQAAEWSEKHDGRLYLRQNQAGYKVLRLKNLLAYADVLVLGNSRVLGINSQTFSSENVFNMAYFSNGRYPFRLIPELEIIRNELKLVSDKKLKRIYIGIDLPRQWVESDIDSIQRIEEVAKLLENSSNTEIEINENIQLKELLSLALTRVSLENLFIAKGASAKKEYICDGNILMRDFTRKGQNLCDGFNADGSYTFIGNLAADYRPVIEKEMVYQSKELIAANGKLNTKFAEILLNALQDFKIIGIEVNLVLPPYAPGFETFLMENSKVADSYKKIKNKFINLAKVMNFTVSDLTKSEDFGCEKSDFFDYSHAHAECYLKIFAGK